MGDAQGEKRGGSGSGFSLQSTVVAGLEQREQISLELSSEERRLLFEGRSRRRNRDGFRLREPDGLEVELEVSSSDGARRSRRKRDPLRFNKREPLRGEGAPSPSSVLL
jgi:hypothetical protein